MEIKLNTDLDSMKYKGSLIFMPQRNYWRHIVITLSVRQLVIHSVTLPVQCIAPICFEVGIPNLDASWDGGVSRTIFLGHCDLDL